MIISSYVVLPSISHLGLNLSGSGIINENKTSKAGEATGLLKVQDGFLSWLGACIAVAMLSIFSRPRTLFIALIKSSTLHPLLNNNVRPFPIAKIRLKKFHIQCVLFHTSEVPTYLKNPLNIYLCMKNSKWYFLKNAGQNTCLKFGHLMQKAELALQK